MALYYDLPVFKDVYQLIMKIFDYTKDFPREYKFTLGQDLKRDGINLVPTLPIRAVNLKQSTTMTNTELWMWKKIKWMFITRLTKLRNGIINYC